MLEALWVPGLITASASITGYLAGKVASQKAVNEIRSIARDAATVVANDRMTAICEARIDPLLAELQAVRERAASNATALEAGLGTLSNIIEEGQQVLSAVQEAGMGKARLRRHQPDEAVVGVGNGPRRARKGHAKEAEVPVPVVATAEEGREPAGEADNFNQATHE